MSRHLRNCNLSATSKRLNARYYATHSASQINQAGERPSKSRDPTRVYPTRKANLHAQYLSLVHPKPQIALSTNSQPIPARYPAVILINFKNFNSTQMTKLRTGLNVAVAKYNATMASSKGVKPDLFTSENGAQTIDLTTLRPGLFVPMVRSIAGHNASKRIKSLMKGQVAGLVLHELNPTLLSQLLRVLDKAVPPHPVEDKKKKKPTDEFETPEKARPHPEMTIVGAFMDGRVVMREKRLRDVAKMPTLDSLRAQLVGLLNAPASKLAEVVQAAGGATVARTLEGFRAGLEKEQGDNP